MSREPGEVNGSCLSCVSYKILQAAQLVQQIYVYLMGSQRRRCHRITIGVQNGGKNNSGVLTSGVRMVPC